MMHREIGDSVNCD